MNLGARSSSPNWNPKRCSLARIGVWTSCVRRRPRTMDAVALLPTMRLPETRTSAATPRTLTSRAGLGRAQLTPSLIELWCVCDWHRAQRLLASWVPLSRRGVFGFAQLVVEVIEGDVTNVLIAEREPGCRCGSQEVRYCMYEVSRGRLRRCIACFVRVGTLGVDQSGRHQPFNTSSNVLLRWDGIAVVQCLIHIDCNAESSRIVGFKIEAIDDETEARASLMLMWSASTRSRAATPKQRQRERATTTFTDPTSCSSIWCRRKPWVGQGLRR